MNQLELSEIIDKVVNKSDLTTKDIPSLDLYMDQIMTLFDDHLQDNKRFVDDTSKRKEIYKRANHWNASCL